MRSTWIRAWLATLALLVAAIALARDRVSWLLTVEEPVMDWLLDGTDTSRWDAASVISSPTILIIGTVILVAIGLWLDWRIAMALVITSTVGTVGTALVENVVGRVPPNPELEPSSFPSLAVVQTGVFWGQVALMAWWLRLPRLLFQILVELGIVLTIIVAIRQILSGEIWPSDAVGSAIVIALSLITAALVFESNPAKLPWRDRSQHDSAALSSSQ